MSRLIKADEICYGRLAHCQVRLDEKVIAIVGPNEAGKTTLLEALSFASSSTSMKPAHKPRGIKDNERPHVTMSYILEEADKNEIEDRFNLAICPSKITVTKFEDGSREISFNPDPARSAKLYKYLRNMSADDRLDDEARAQLNAVITCFDEEGKLTPSQYNYLMQSLTDLGLEKHASCLQDVLDFLDKDLGDNIANAVLEYLPKCIFFDNESRNLLGEYDINEDTVNNPPVALSNLLKLAGTNITALNEALAIEETLADSIIEQGNALLKERFEVAWTQSSVLPKMKMSGTRLSLQFKEPSGDITRFDSRSTGLRAFVALLAFIFAKGIDANSILLIDEAESHLHVDAQVNLVDTFLRQSLIGKIIYTTHSPACLPPDFGNAIKAVTPDPNNEFMSLITSDLNSLNPNGVFPLSLAMGAMAAAISAFKTAVIVEGASDAILLPTLIKLTHECDSLPYRIVPGLAQTSPDLFVDYERIGAHVIYVVDGDAEGSMYVKKLKQHGISENRIIQLDPGMTLEDLVSYKAYTKAFAEILTDEGLGPDLSCLPKDPCMPGKRAKLMSEWCKDNKLKSPSKNAVAYRLIDSITADDIPDNAKNLIHKIHLAAMDQLG